MAEAGPLHRKALDINRIIFGEDHPGTAAGYNNVAHNLDDLGKAAEAGPLYRKALDINRKVLGEDHPDTATSYNNLAHSLDDLGKAAEAGPLYRKALDIRRKALGEDHPDTAASYINLAHSLDAQGKAAEAINVLTAGVPVFESSRLAAAKGIDRANLTNFNPRLLLAALQQIHNPAAWTQLEYSLARGLFDQQAMNGTTRLTSAEQQEQQAARIKLAELQPRLLKLVSTTNRSPAETQELDHILTERRTVEATISRLAVADSERAVSSPDRIRAALPADTALFYWIDVASQTGNVQEHWVCVVRNSGDPKWERLPGTGPDRKWSREDSALPGKLRTALAGAAPRAEVEALAKQLHDQRIAPVLKHLDGVKTLYCVPVYEMAGIPVEALTPDYTISYIPSGTYLTRFKDRPKSAGKQLLAVGDPVFDNPNAEKPKAGKRLPPGGLLLTTVAPDGAAFKAGINVGDVLLKYGTIELTDLDKLKVGVTANAGDKSVQVTVWRETEEKPFTREIAAGKLGVVLAPDPDAAAAAAVAVTAESSDDGVVRVIGTAGSGADHTLSLAAMDLGSAVVTVTATDAEGLTSLIRFVVSVERGGPGGNTNPTLVLPATVTTAADAPAAVRIEIDDAESPPDQLWVGVSTDNYGLFPTSSIVVTGTGRDRTLTLWPAPGRSGTATLTVFVRDPDGVTVSRTLVVTVTPREGPAVPPTVPPAVPPAAAGPARFAVGTDAGGGTVRLYNGDGILRFAVDPFPGFTGGVRTATADFNGDGVADIVAGTGPGRATRVVILDGQTGAQLFAVDPFEAGFTGGVYVAAADLNGDGTPDLVVTPDEGGGPRVDIYSGKGFGKFASFFGIDDPSFRGGARAATGDLNGDGRADLIVVAGFGGGPRVAGFDGMSIGGTPTHLFGDFFAFEQTLRNGIFVAVGDLDGDGYAELIAGGGPGGGPRVTAFDGKALLANVRTVRANFFGGDDRSRGGVRVSATDLDRDRRADLIVGAGSGAGSRVTAYYGKDVSAAGTPAEAFAFDAFGGFTGGVFVG